MTKIAPALPGLFFICMVLKIYNNMPLVTSRAFSSPAIWVMMAVANDMAAPGPFPVVMFRSTVTLSPVTVAPVRNCSNPG